MNDIQADKNTGFADIEVQIIATLVELKVFCKEIEEFLTNNAKDHSFSQNPHVLIAEYERNPKLTPFIIITRYNAKIMCIAIGNIAFKHFNLSFSIIKLPAPQLKILNLPGNGLVFKKKCNREQHIDRIFNILKKHSQEIDIIALNEITSTSPLWRYITQHYTSHNSYFRLIIASTKQEIISWHELMDSYEHWYRSLHAKTRKRISWERKRFQKRAPQPINIKKITKEIQVAEFMKQVQFIRKNSWQGKTIASKKQNINNDIAFFEKIASHGWLRSYLLLCEGIPAAYELSIQYNNECTFLERGYNQKLYKLAPGTFLTYHIMQDVYDNLPPRTINFGFGENEFKKRLRTKTETACYAYLTMPGRWRLLASFQQGLNFAENKINNLLTRTNLDNRIRKILKHKK